MKMLASSSQPIGRETVVRQLRNLSLGFALILGCTATRGLAQQTERLDFFESRIRPVLVEHCYECHNSAEQSEGDFALDHREPFRQGGSGGLVIMPGDPVNSRLMKILRHEIEGLEMPEGGERLSPDVIADFEKWITDGALDPRDAPPSEDQLQQSTSWSSIREKRKQWWSFQPIIEHQPPAATQQGASTHPIDRFIHHRLQEVGLKPARLAPNEVLVRRYFYALIGLPPTYEQLASWSQRLDASEGPERQSAIDELVDQLLAKPEFGERWARHWMDWIRYAESHGSEGDPRIEQAWLYRDYLIRAINADVPVDQLIMEHIAGDLLETSRLHPANGIRESLIGPAHFRMVFHGFAPTDALDEKVRFTDDQINAVSKAFLGLTVSCARCHDHKFDPISQADYYALYGILASCRPGRTVIDNQDALAGPLENLSKLKSQLRLALAERWTADVDRWDEDKLDSAFYEATKEPRWPESVQGDFKYFWDFANPIDYASWYRVGSGLPETAQRSGEFQVGESGQQIIEQVFPSGVAANGLSTKLPARLSSPSIQLSPNEQVEVWMLARGGGRATVRYVVQDYPRDGTVYPVRELTPQYTWHKFDLSYWAGDSLHFELTTALDAPLLVKPQERSWFEIRYCIVAEKGRFNPPVIDKQANSIFQPDSAPPTKLELATVKAAMLTLIDGWRNQSLSDRQALLLNQLLESGYLQNEPAGDLRLAELVNKYREVETSIPVPTRIPALEETHGRDQPLFIRGNHKQPGTTIPRRFLEAIDATPYETLSSGRLEFAKDLLRDDNPLTRRVMVNRVWLHLFGQGLVATPDNFGRVGDKPSHPELLDWLAIEFQRQGWSIKSLVRMIVTSETWQRESVGDQHANKLDPGNRLLSHQNVRRLEAEAIRDTMFFLSGQLQKSLGGPPVPGSQPRRSVYVNVIRNNLDAFLRVFDFPEPFSTVGRRDATNVPAQSLTLMNDPLVKRLAADLAQRTLSQVDPNNDPNSDNPSRDTNRVRWMMQETLQRTVQEIEVEQAVTYLQAIGEHANRMAQRHRQLTERLKETLTEQDALQRTVRSRLLTDATIDSSEATQPMAQPIGSWEFETSVGLQLMDNATVADGSLKLSGGYALTSPIERDLFAKTLEAVVQLDSLEQRGGGVISVQNRSGEVFDAIVFGERDPGQWLAGSNHFARTDSFSGPSETEAKSRPVHFAIVYHPDGQIVAYRNGEVYGRSYKSNGPHRFSANDTIIGFGIRHLPAGGNRMLAGTIHRAGLYDRALNDAEVRQLANNHGPYISEEQILAAMSPAERRQRERLSAEIVSLESELKELGPESTTFDQRSVWTELAHALFTLKEFIYVR